TAITPPSANVASLMKVTDVPVSYYTGTVQIGIPIHTINTNFASLNISLGYNSSGVKVEDEPGLTGAGWNLTAGGSIARSAAASPDEGYGTKYGYRYSAAHYGLPLYYADQEANNWYNTLTDCNMKELSEGKFYDLAPDIYYLNFNGYSAKMFFDKNGTPMISPYKAWKVEGNEASGFTITVENGTKYIFDLIEVTTSSTYGNSDAVESPDADVKTAWFLTKVVSASLADTIRLNYTAISYWEDAKNADETIADFKKGQTQYSCDAPSSLSNYTYIYNSRDISTYLLSSIETRAERVEFSIQSGRRDVNDTIGLPYQLNDIKVYDRLTAGYPPVRKFHLNYSYFGDT
ncbi:MAG TPA: hypothetical protein VLD19_04015, partial [Chitinophagaceae bacterium]|nr:hypothetical protein [Chitinophagaceae bacterium]